MLLYSARIAKNLPSDVKNRLGYSRPPTTWSAGADNSPRLLPGILLLSRPALADRTNLASPCFLPRRGNSQSPSSRSNTSILPLRFPVKESPRIRYLYQVLDTKAILRSKYEQVFARKSEKANRQSHALITGAELGPA